jgi:hypothetical protein
MERFVVFSQQNEKADGGVFLFQELLQKKIIV